MKVLLLSDIHVEFQERYAVEPTRLISTEPTEDIVFDTLDYIWDYYDIPITDGLILAGDYSNDYGRFTHIIPWLSKKYSKVWLVLGNHDLTCRGATDSLSNLQFASTEQKIAKMKELCSGYPNIYLLDGSVHSGIGGCAGFCDFRCEAPSFGLDPFTRWKRQWYDGKYMRYFGQEPRKIWEHYDIVMEKLTKQHPKVMVTHFVPYQLGVSFDFRNHPWNYVFYFNAEKYLENMGDDTYWFCGHVHGRRKAEYVNSHGNHIHIWCNPIGYPGEHSKYIEMLDYSKEKLKRTSTVGSHEFFIIDL